eukprot:COSAG01_NODE_26592_length_708_cov_27.765189_1_plen_69_part_00
MREISARRGAEQGLVGIDLDLPRTGCAVTTIGRAPGLSTCVAGIRGVARGGVPTESRRVVGAGEELCT